MNKSFSHEEFLQLITANKGIIVKICNVYCADKSYHEDLAQEIIYQLWKSGQSFREGFRFSTWMYRIALNVAISHYRKEKNKTSIVSTDELPVEIADRTSDTAEMDHYILQLQGLINEMNALDKALMILYLDSRSYSEIADILGITETNVATKISRIKSRLKQQLTTNNSSDGRN